MFKWSKQDFIILPLTLLIIITISIILFYVLRNKSEKIKKIPLIVITLTMLTSEAIKQILKIIEGYNTWSIPLHFCSLFLYFYPLAVFAKGKLKEFGKTMSLVCSILMTVSFYISPGAIMGKATSHLFQSYSTFHTFLYHHLVILFLFVSLLTNFYSYKKSNYLHVIIGFNIYAAIVIPAAHILQSNYCDMLKSNIAFLETFRLFAGQIAYTLVLYLFALIAGTFIVFVQSRLQKNKNKQN